TRAHERPCVRSGRWGAAVPFVTAARVRDVGEGVVVHLARGALATRGAAAGALAVGGAGAPAAMLADPVRPRAALRELAGVGHGLGVFGEVEADFLRTRRAARGAVHVAAQLGDGTAARAVPASFANGHFGVIPGAGRGRA